MINSRVYLELGLREEEYRKVVRLLGREPNYLELSMISVMWSEHCAYKHSRSLFKLFPTQAPYVIQGPGENAGVVDIGDGLAVVFKMESHNHPSAVEPFQGAATGVGGIVRDIIAMGARPIALLDPLRFGSLDSPRVKYLFEQVVAGIAHYGNCIGVPTVGGDVYFEEAYEGNPLVNVMCVGLALVDGLMSGRAQGEGNLVVLLGSKTGRDGIHGCTFASEELSETSEERRPSVQVGDPFTEKLLIEACLELGERKLLVALQDLGAAGLTSSSSEMANRGRVGIDIDVLKVPRREERMAPFEVMISESQERMLAVVKPENFPQVQEVCRRWGIEAAPIGKVTATNKIRVFEGDQLKGELPVSLLTEEAPVYQPEARFPAYLKEDSLKNFRIEEPRDYNEVLLRVITSPNLASREWVYTQYDHMVQTNTVLLPGSDAAVLRIKGTEKALAVSTDGNGRYTYLNPYRGAQIAVAEAARNLTAVGAKPLAITDCLNFGNPEDPEVYWQFREAVKGIADACRALDLVVVSGNVSFYNETEGQAIYPTPVIGAVGLLEDVSCALDCGFSEEGAIIVLVGETYPELGGSEYLRTVQKEVRGEPPVINLEKEKRVQGFIREAAREGFLLSAHDLAEGGLAIALAESALKGGWGFKVELDESLSPVEFLFSETQSRLIVSLSEENLPRLRMLSAKYLVDCFVIGHITGKNVIFGDIINLPLSEVEAVWKSSLKAYLL